MAYDSEYNERLSAKRHLTRPYSGNEIKAIQAFIKEYYGEQAPFLNSNPAYFIQLASAINESLYKNKMVLKPGYLAEVFDINVELYNVDKNVRLKRRSIQRMTAIREFLEQVLAQRGIEKKQLLLGKTGALSNWTAITNTATPQWAEYVELPLKSGILRRVTCEISTKSKYYRFGFKFFLPTGKLFGDGSIQSQDNNFVIHVAKNFTKAELFITAYRNGIREGIDNYIGVIPKKNSYICELHIDEEEFIHFRINNKEVYKKLINREIRTRVYMLAWGDGNHYEINVNNILIETDRA